MNDVNILNTISIICFSIAGVLLIIGIILFIKFDVIGIINDLRGKKAQKQIEKIRENYSRTSRVRYNLDRNGSSEEITEDIEKTDEIIDKPITGGKSELSHIDNSIDADTSNETEETDLLQEEVEEGTEVLTGELEEGTELLTGELEEGTEVLSEGTVVLVNNDSDTSDETTLLDFSSDETTLLQEDSISDFKIIKNIISINTNEYI